MAQVSCKNMKPYKIAQPEQLQDTETYKHIKLNLNNNELPDS